MIITSKMEHMANIFETVKDSEEVNQIINPLKNNLLALDYNTEYYRGIFNGCNLLVKYCNCESSKNICSVIMGYVAQIITNKKAQLYAIYIIDREIMNDSEYYLLRMLKNTNRIIIDTYCKSVKEKNIDFSYGYYKIMKYIISNIPENKYKNILTLIMGYHANIVSS
jgi:hypothetical protein